MCRDAMNQVGMLSLLIVCSFVATTPAQKAADVSGTWVLDISRSESPGYDGLVPRRQSIEHADSTLTVLTDYGERTERLVYTSDGTENILDAQSTDARGSFRWDGSTLVTVIVRTINGQSVTSEQRRTLRAGDQELLVETMTKVEHGYNRPQTALEPKASIVRDVYVKAIR